MKNSDFAGFFERKNGTKTGSIFLFVNYLFNEENGVTKNDLFNDFDFIVVF